jgi:hypothetical protein
MATPSAEMLQALLKSGALNAVCDPGQLDFGKLAACWNAAACWHFSSAQRAADRQDALMAATRATARGEAYTPPQRLGSAEGCQPWAMETVILPPEIHLAPGVDLERLKQTIAAIQKRDFAAFYGLAGGR